MLQEEKPLFRFNKIIFLGVFLLLCGGSFCALARERKNIKVDREIQRMEEESHPSAPKGKTDTDHPLSSPHPAIKEESRTDLHHPSQTQHQPQSGVTATENEGTKSSTTGTEAQETKTEVKTEILPDTAGESENKQIFQEDLRVEGVSSINEDIRASVKEETSTEAAGTHGGETTSETSSQPIVDVHVNADLESGKTETQVGVDTSGQLEERQILDAEVAAGNIGSTETEVGSAVDITESDFVEHLDVTTETLPEVISEPADVTADVDATGAAIGGEGDVGLEADVTGVSESEDNGCDGADGLLLGSCQSLLP